MRLKADRKYAAALDQLHVLLTRAESLVPPLHVIYPLALTPAMNLARHLKQWSTADTLILGLLTRMRAIFPSNLPELSDFLVARAENQFDQANEAKEHAMKAQAETEAAAAYEAAYRIRMVACGPEHPRTLAIPARFRTV
jgi:hypothetical protein